MSETVTLHRLNAGNYVTDPAEGPGSWCVCRYFPDGRRTADGWLVEQMRPLDPHDDGTVWWEYTFVEWARTIEDAKAVIAHLTPTSHVTP